MTVTLDHHADRVDACSTRGRLATGRTADPVAMLEDLVRLHQQLEALATSPVVTGSHRLLADVAPVLEPVWSILVTTNDAQGGVGFLRRLGIADPAGEAAQLNAAVVTQAVATYRSLELIAPSTREVWRGLARPARALLESVRGAAHLDASSEPAATPHAAALNPTPRPVLPRELLGAWERDTEVVPALRRLLRQWCEMARHTTGERREVARLTLAAALLARGAVLDGDAATVAWFVNRWLGLRPSDSRIDGACAALLEDGWTRPSLDEAFSAVRDAVTDLRIEAMYQHRLHRPVWETQLRGRPVALLSDPAGWQDTDDGAVQVEIADVLMDTDDVCLVEATVTESLIAEEFQRVLFCLPEPERVIATRIVEGLSWAEIKRELNVSRYAADKARTALARHLRTWGWPLGSDEL